jgi:hypothetical protein
MARYKSFLDRVRTWLGTQEIRHGSVSLPARIGLYQVSNPQWTDVPEMSAIANGLRDLGFEKLGAFRSEHIPNLQVAYFVKHQQSVVATVYESASSGIWVDYSSPYQDGTAFNYSTAPTGRLHNAPASHSQAAFPRCDVISLYQKFIEDRPDKPLRVVDADRLVSEAEEAYAKETMRRASARR